jgi:hypothetical protein
MLGRKLFTDASILQVLYHGKKTPKKFIISEIYPGTKSPFLAAVSTPGTTIQNFFFKLGYLVLNTGSSGKYKRWRKKYSSLSVFIP